MKKRNYVWNLLTIVLAATLSFGLSSCSGDDDDVKLELSGLDATFPSEAGSLQAAQELTIKCNTKWEISTDADWIVVDSRNGSGNKNVKVWMKSENNSTDTRSAILTVTAGSQSESKTIIQEAGKNGKLYVMPNDVVIMSDGFACDWNYGSDVMYYYVRMYLPSAIDRQTDEEIIAKMSSDIENRDTPGDGYVTSWYLNSQTDYILCTVGYDRNGKSGALTKYPITTKKGTNQALATISDIGYDNTYWYWTTSINGFVTKYYQWFITRSDLHTSSNPAIAWFFKREMTENPNNFDPIVNGTSWQRLRNGGNIFDLATWAVDVDGNFSGLIDRFAGEVTSSSSVNIQKVNKSVSGNLKRFKTMK